MISLLIGVGALFLAVIGCAIVDPWPRPSSREEPGDTALTMDLTTLPI